MANFKHHNTDVQQKEFCGCNNEIGCYHCYTCKECKKKVRLNSWFEHRLKHKEKDQQSVSTS